ncbi:MAG: hypothetical protein AB1610_00190 [Nitrospirota bacterium]
MEEKKKKRKRRRKVFRYSSYFNMRVDPFTLEMLDRIAYDEDKMRPEVIRSAVKYLFIKKYDAKELEKLRKKHRPYIASDVSVEKDIDLPCTNETASKGVVQGSPCNISEQGS